MNDYLTLEELGQLKARGIIDEAEFERRKKLLARKLTREQTTAKSGVIYILLAFFLGCLGLHNFYVKRPIRGLIQILLFATSWLFLFLPLIILSLWLYLEIMFTNHDGNGNHFKSSSGMIWFLRLGLTIFIAYTFLNMQNAGELITSDLFIASNFL